MVRPTAAQKAKTVQKQQCGSCNEVFSGKICPNCHEKVNIFPINADGLPIAAVSDVIGGTPDLAINLNRSPDYFDPDYEMESALQQQFKDVIRDANLDKVKTLAAEQAAKRLRAEKELEATKQGFMPPKEGEPQQEEQSGFASMSPGIFLQALGGWDPEQREQFLNQLASNPALALSLSMMMNPGKSGGMNPMGMMNPMAMMGGMMQPPAEPVPQASATEMVTAMIAGMQTLQELGGGNKGNDGQLDRVMDKMDEMRKETENLKLQLIEERNTNRGVGPDEIRVIVADALSRNSEQRANIREGVEVLNDLQQLKSGMVDLGLMQEVTLGSDKPSIEDKRLDHEIRMDEKREARDHELKIESERAAQADAETKGAFINGLFAAAHQQPEEEKEEHIEEIKSDTVKADITRPAAVIS